MILRLSAWAALLFGSFLALAEAYRNWGAWQWWPFWLVDYMAAALLIYGAWIALRSGRKASLAAGWGFTAAMFWMSLFSHIAEHAERATQAYGPDGNVSENELTRIITAMTALAFAGLISTLLSKSHAPRK